MTVPAQTPSIDAVAATADRQPVGWLPVGGAAVLAATLLLATNHRYDYHRDELYFRMLRPAWGYVDQPPLTPFLARTSAALFGDTVWAMRLPAAICVAAAIILAALIAREFGGGRAAQTLAAFGYATASIPLVFGHIMLTATVDLPVWLAILLFLARALRGEPRWFLAAGVTTGLALYNKHLIVLLLISVAIGLLWMGPRRILLSSWLWAGVGLALLVGLPNLVYQVANDFPQLSMAAALSDDNGGENRAMLVPFQFLLLGPPLVAIWVAGLVAMLRRQTWRWSRAFAVAYPVLLAITLISGGQFYYSLGLVGFLFAAGCVPTVDWIARRMPVRRALIIGAVALNAAVALLIGLPLLPVTVIGDTPIPAINQGIRDQIGWREYTRQVAGVYHALPATDQAKAVVVTANYGEAGAIDRYGPEFGLPQRIYSGHNELFTYGPPAEADTVAITIGMPLARLSLRFAMCAPMLELDNGVGVDNEEQGAQVVVCRDPVGGWTAAWPYFEHLS